MLKYTIATGQLDTDILAEYGVYVKGTSGLLGRPDFKSQTKFNWPYLNGEYVDIRERRYKPRDILMRCWLKGENKQQAIDRINTFLKAFSAASLIRLHVEFVNMSGAVNPLTKGLFYLVYLTKTNISKYFWRNGKQIVEFELTLTEPSPVKRIFQVNATDVGEVSLACNTPSEIDIHWGDGDVDYDCIGNVSLQHEYNTTGKHYIIVTGVIQDITEFTITGQTEIQVTEIYNEI